MKTLRRLQRDFQDYVLRGRGAAISAEVVEGYGADTATRLKIYHDAYRLRLAEALRAAYPTLEAVLGRRAFGDLALAYIAAHPSPHRNIRCYGEAMETWLRAASPWRERPWLSELAAFEWRMLAAFDAPDAPVATADSVAAVPPSRWPALVFELHPSVQRLDLGYAVPPLWKAHQAGEAVTDCRPAVHKGAWVVWRRGIQVYFRSLAEDEAPAFDALGRGAPFAEVCECIGAGRGALRAASLLKGWLNEGLIRRFRLAGGGPSRSPQP